MPNALSDDGPDATPSVTEGVAWVYVPTRPCQASDSVEFELRQLPDGTGALPVFTDPELLVERFGAFQPQRKVAVLDLLTQVSAAKVPVVVNPILDDEAPRWSEATLDKWQRENS